MNARLVCWRCQKRKAANGRHICRPCSDELNRIAELRFKLVEHIHRMPGNRARKSDWARWRNKRHQLTAELAELHRDQRFQHELPV